MGPVEGYKFAEKKLMEIMREHSEARSFEMVNFSPESFIFLGDDQSADGIRRFSYMHI